MVQYIKYRCFLKSYYIVFKNMLSRTTVESFKQFCQTIAELSDTGGSRFEAKHVFEKIMFKVYVHWHIHFNNNLDN